MCTSISIKSAQSPLKCGDFCFPVLMFEDLRSYSGVLLSSSLSIYPLAASDVVVLSTHTVPVLDTVTTVTTAISAINLFLFF